MKISHKLYIGFCLILALVLIIGITGLTKSKTIIKSYDNALELNQKSQFLDQKLNDHFVWMQSLTNSILLGDEIKLQMDWHKCGFGGWYYDIKESDEYSKLSPEEKKNI